MLYGFDYIFLLIFSTAIKSGIAFSAVYWTREFNVWGSSKDTAKLYEQISREAQPHLKSLTNKIPVEVITSKYS